MKKHIRTFLAGVVVVAPLGVTVWIVWSLATWIGNLGLGSMERLGVLKNLGLPAVKDLSVNQHLAAQLAGAVVIVACVYFVGMLTQLWVFGQFLGWLDKLLGRVPGIKTIYESVRDLLRLFSGTAAHKGRAVQYRPPGSDIAILGIVTNDHPAGMSGSPGSPKVAVYLPLAYMLGGPTIYVSPEHLTDVDLTVDEALKLAATAQIVQGTPTPKTDEKN